MLRLDWSIFHQSCTFYHFRLNYCTVLYCTVQHPTALYFTLLHCTPLHCTTLHCSELHCTALHCTGLHCTTLHCTALPSTALHWFALTCAILQCTSCTILPRTDPSKLSECTGYASTFMIKTTGPCNWDHSSISKSSRKSDVLQH